MKEKEKDRSGSGMLFEPKNVEDMSLEELIELQRRYPARFVRVLDKSFNIKVPVGLLHIPVLSTGA